MILKFYPLRSALAAPYTPPLSPALSPEQLLLDRRKVDSHVGERAHRLRRHRRVALRRQRQQGRRQLDLP